jgi:hypothetical protein
MARNVPAWPVTGSKCFSRARNSPNRSEKTRNSPKRHKTAQYSPKRYKKDWNGPTWPKYFWLSFSFYPSLVQCTNRFSSMTTQTGVMREHTDYSHFLVPSFHQIQPQTRIRFRGQISALKMSITFERIIQIFSNFNWRLLKGISKHLQS